MSHADDKALADNTYQATTNNTASTEAQLKTARIVWLKALAVAGSKWSISNGAVKALHDVGQAYSQPDQFG
jgi:hypothetical protein